MTQPTSQPSPISTTPPQKRLSPLERLRRGRQRSFWIRLFGGVGALLLLLLAIHAGWSWSSLLLAWVLLAFIADEFGGYFGYVAALMGLLILKAPGQDPAQWKILLPLVGGALLASLIVKHSGGWLVLPFAAAVFLLPFYAASEYGHLLDPNLLALGDPELMRAAGVGMVVGLGISFVRQFVIWLVDLSAMLRERRLLRADDGGAASVPTTARARGNNRDVGSASDEERREAAGDSSSD